MYIDIMQPMLVMMVLIVVVVFSVSLIFQRYHSAGEGTDIRNYKEYGEPAKSLYTSRYLFSFHKDIDVTDEMIMLYIIHLQNYSLLQMKQPSQIGKIELSQRLKRSYSHCTQLTILTWLGESHSNFQKNYFVS